MKTDCTSQCLPLLVSLIYNIYLTLKIVLVGINHMTSYVYKHLKNAYLHLMSHSVAQDILELTAILLSPLPQC